MNKREQLNGQAGALEEFEITPEMIEAGAEVLSHYDYGWVDNGEYLKKILTATMAARSPATKLVFLPAGFRT